MVMFALGLIYLLVKRNKMKPFTLAALGMIVVIFSFFSLFVATKMPALVYPVSSLIIVISGAGAIALVQYGIAWIKSPDYRLQCKPILLLLVGLMVSYSTFKPQQIAFDRREDNAYRNNKIQNNTAYRHLGKDVVGERVILNCRPYENIELMFYQDVLAYHWYPQAEQIDSLKKVGYRFAAFDYPGDPQALPEWIGADTSILILPYALK
jgi:hypothetical protein